MIFGRPQGQQSAAAQPFSNSSKATDSIRSEGTSNREFLQALPAGYRSPQIGNLWPGTGKCLSEFIGSHCRKLSAQGCAIAQPHLFNHLAKPTPPGNIVRHLVKRIESPASFCHEECSLVAAV
ncbi:MAG: hypothetical protein KTV68_17900 [Acidimicrobiia bacterium]|nr:hypothetical protein [Acidimicrobiia bacterium]